MKLFDDADANIPAITQQKGTGHRELRTPLVIWESHAFTRLATDGHAIYCTEPRRSTHLPSASGIEGGFCHYLDGLVDAFLNSEILVSGQSLKGPPQKGIHFWGESGKGKNQAILWHSTINAREWFSAMTVE